MIIKIIGIAFITAFVSLVLKKEKPEMAIVVSICGGVVISLMLVEELEEVISFFNIFATDVKASDYLKPVIKIVGVGYLTEFSTNLLEESGQKFIANKIVLGGKVVIFLICIPTIKTIFEMLFSLI